MKELESKIKKSLSRIKTGDSFSDRDLVIWLKDVYKLLDNDNEQSYNLCLASICFIADRNPSDPMVVAILNEAIIKSRIFLYRDMLEKQSSGFLENNPISCVSEFTKWFYTDPISGTVLTKSQREISELFKKQKRLVISAPTSFGKTRILEELILNNNYGHIAIVVPTNALLSENYHRLKRNLLISDKYGIIYSSKIGRNFDLSGNMIFILTPEKLLNLLDEHQITFDFFVFDEFYKISKDFESGESGDYDRRYKVFQYALYTLVQNTNTDFYMIGPYIDKFSKKFLEKENAVFKEYKVEIVQKRIFLEKSAIDKQLGINLLKDKKKSAYKVLDKLREQDQLNLIYVPRQETAEKLARAYAEHLDDSGIDLSENVELKDFIRYIKDNISPEWNLIRALKKGVAFHHGGIPRYIQTEIISLFEKRIIHSLICTTTLAEGVNTSAKNVVVYEAKKSKENLTTFDRKNIEGRSGRFNEHFIGNVFYLSKPMDQERETGVDFELYDSPNLRQEDVILVKNEDLSADNLKNKEQALSKLQEKNIPQGLIQKNRFINIDKQISLIESLRTDLDLPFKEIKNNNEFINNKDLCDLLFQNVFKLANTDDRGAWNGYTFKQLSWLARSYMFSPYFKTLVGHKLFESSKNIDTRIRRALRLMSQHFEFLIPRYMQVFQEIYNFVAIERNARNIELGRVVSLLEYGTADQVEILLRDTGLPLEIVNKIKKHFRGCEDANAILARRKEKDGELRNELDEFELRLMDRYL